MQSFFKRGNKRAPSEDTEATNPGMQHTQDQSSTPTLLNQAIPTAIPPMNGSEVIDPGNSEKGNRESIHALQGTLNNDAEKHLTSPSSDVKALLDDVDPQAAHILADKNERQDARTSATPTEDEDAEGYLKGFPLYMAYLAMLLSIFLVSLDFTIM